MSERAERMGEAALFGGVRYYWDRPSILARITAADLSRVARQYLVSENMRLVVLLPKDAAALSEESQKAFHDALEGLGAAGETAKAGFEASAYPPAEASRVDPLAWGNPKGASGPASATRAALKNGVTLVWLEDHRQPLAAVSLHLKTGSGDDPLGREGLAAVALRLLAARTAARAQAVAGGGRRLTIVPEAQATRDFLEIRFVGLAADVKPGLEALAYTLQQPLPGEASLETTRQSALASLDRASRSIENLGVELFREKVYAGDAYAHRPEGTISGLQAITAEDLQALGGRMLRPDRVVLSVTGDFEGKQLQRDVERLFGGWPAPAAKQEKADSVTASSSPGSSAIASPGASSPGSATAGAQPGEYSRQISASQSRVVAGAPALPLLDPSFQNLRLLSAAVTLLTFEDMVFTRRAAFSVVAIPEGLRRGGSVAFEVVSAPAQRSVALFDLHRLMRHVATDALSEDDRRDIARMLSGRSAAAVEGVLPLASHLAYREAAGLQARSWRDDFALATPAADRLKTLAETYFKPEDWISILVGPAAP
jgi:predicted Zn-dependent peptidase